MVTLLPSKQIQNPPHLLIPWQPPGLPGQLPVAQHRHRERLSEATVELMRKKQHFSFQKIAF